MVVQWCGTCSVCIICYQQLRHVLPLTTEDEEAKLFEYIIYWLNS